MANLMAAEWDFSFLLDRHCSGDLVFLQQGPVTMIQTQKEKSLVGTLR